ncbi:MAG: nitrous oxide reductase accessory protein NosL [Gammaproteobacteria bacterium]|nr:nitrous oxide reductase accessory protein NosL [Gammaproteobacteria bacterium]
MAARALAILMTLALLAGPALAGPVDVPQPGPRASCPVCGMFVARYPEWVATVIFKDGHVHHFDGAKDLFKFLFALDKYAPGHRPGDIDIIAVTDYYDLETIDAREAWFVIGSDVYGPMGHELVPLKTAKDAAGFSADHDGRATLRFDDITPTLIRHVDEGRFDDPKAPAKP